MTTRFLLTVISSFYFDGDETLDDLHDEITQDALKLYSTGIDVSSLAGPVCEAVVAYNVFGGTEQIVTDSATCE